MFRKFFVLTFFVLALSACTPVQPATAWKPLATPPPAMPRAIVGAPTRVSAAEFVAALKATATVAVTR